MDGIQAQRAKLLGKFNTIKEVNGGAMTLSPDQKLIINGPNMRTIGDGADKGNSVRRGV